MDRNLKNIKASGFKTPENYFEGVEDSVLNQIHLKSIEGSGFKIPEGYLDTLDDTIIAKASKNNDSKVINLFSRKNLLCMSSVAAAVLLLFNLSIFESKRVASFDTLDTATLENYILSEYIDSYEISSLMNNEEINEEAFIDYDFSDEHMEDYILNNIDIEGLFLE